MRAEGDVVVTEVEEGDAGVTGQAWATWAWAWTYAAVWALAGAAVMPGKSAVPSSIVFHACAGYEGSTYATLALRGEARHHHATDPTILFQLLRLRQG